MSRTIATEYRDGVYWNVAEGRPLRAEDYADAIHVTLGDGETTILQAGDKLPDPEPVEETKEPTAEERLARIERALTSKQSLAEIKAEIEKPIERLEFVEGDDPATPEVEKGFWRTALSVVTLGLVK